MKTKAQNSKAGLKSRPEQVSTVRKAEGNQPKVDFAKREANRKSPLQEVIDLLSEEAPLLCRMAEIVGRWVWIRFPERQPREITSTLSQLGFHWNKRRQTWQHPCGVFCDQRADYDPRDRYGSRTAA